MPRGIPKSKHPELYQDAAPKARKLAVKSAKRPSISFQVGDGTDIKLLDSSGRLIVTLAVTTVGINIHHPKAKLRNGGVVAYRRAMDVLKFLAGDGT